MTEAPTNPPTSKPVMEAIIIDEWPALCWETVVVAVVVGGGGGVRVVVRVDDDVVSAVVVDVCLASMSPFGEAQTQHELSDDPSKHRPVSHWSRVENCSQYRT